MEPSNYTNVTPEEWTIFNFQRCSWFPASIFTRLQPASSQTSLDSWLSLEIAGKKSSSRLLVRHSLINTQEHGERVKCDMRVRELLCTDDPGGQYTHIMVPTLDLAVAQLMDDMKHDFWAWYGSAKLKLPRYPVELTLENQSTSFNILKSGSIKVMKLTLILTSIAEIQEKDGSLKSKSYMYKEVLRDCFKSYNLHVKSNTLVDLRGCPLASGVCPKVSFVYINECTMRKSETQIGKVNSQTLIVIDRFHDVNYYLRILECLPSDLSLTRGLLHGLELPFQIIQSSMERQKHCTSYSETNGCAASQGFLLAGPSGSGKTLVVNEVSRKYCANLLVLDFSHEASTLRNNPRRVANLCTNIFSEGIQSSWYMGYPTVILLENLDVLYTGGENSKESVSKIVNNKHKIINHLCDLFDLIEQRKVLPITIVGTTTKPYLIPPKMRRFGRLQQEIFIKVPNESQRVGILESLKKQIPGLSSMDSESVARKTPGYVGADLLRLTHLAVLKAHEGSESEVSGVHIKYALARVLPSVLQGSVGVVDIQRTLSLDHISGLHSVKLELIKTIVWPLHFPQAFLQMGITPPKGILLYGPPGCGKTTLVRAVAASHQTNFLSVSAAELFSSAVGDSEKIVSHLFHQARMASPCILFIDELESIVGSRDVGKGSKGKSMNETILSMLLTEMDGIGVRALTAPSAAEKNKSSLDGPRVVVVGATNRPDMIDSALLRPGRFDRMVPVPPPNEADRLEMLRQYTTKTPLADDVNLVKLAAETDRFSGADLSNLCREAALFALAENMDISSVRMEHYARALAQLSPSISQEYLVSFHEYASANGYSSTLDLTNKLKALRI